jgi:hypothetical protein
MEKTALQKYEVHNNKEKGSATIEEIKATIQGIDGWANNAGEVCDKGHKFEYKTEVPDGWDFAYCDNCSAKIDVKRGYLHCEPCELDFCPKCQDLTYYECAKQYIQPT